MRERILLRAATGRWVAPILLLAVLSATLAWGEEPEPQAVPLLGFRTNLLFAGQAGRIDLPAEATEGVVAAEVTGDVLRLAERAFAPGTPRFVEVLASGSGRARLTVPEATVRHYEVAVPGLSHDRLRGALSQPVAWDEVKGRVVLLVGVARASMEGVGWALECGGDTGTVQVLGIPAPKAGTETGVLGLLDRRSRLFRRAWSRVHVVRPGAAEAPRVRIVVEQGDLVLFPVPGTRSTNCQAEIEGNAVVVPWQIMRWGIAQALRPGAATVRMHCRHWQSGRRGGGVRMGEDRRGGGSGDRVWTLDVEVAAPKREAWARAAMALLASALEARTGTTGEYPNRLDGLLTKSVDTGLEIGAADGTDPWGRPYRLRTTPRSELLYTDGGDQGSPAYRLESSGPDGKPGTPDDLVFSQPSTWWFQAEVHEEEPEPE